MWVLSCLGLAHHHLVRRQGLRNTVAAGVGAGEGAGAAAAEMHCLERSFLVWGLRLVVSHWERWQGWGIEKGRESRWGLASTF